VVSKRRQIHAGLLALVLSMLMAQPAAGLRGLQVGMKAPEFTLQSFDGTTVSLSGLRQADVVVVVFWATWSEHSAEELERLERLYREHKDKGLAVAAINVENQRIGPEDLEAIRRVVQHGGLTYPVLVDRRLETFHSYGVIAVPSTVVVDREGTIRAEMAAYPLGTREDLFDLIESLVTGRAPRQKVVKAGDEPKPRAVRYYNLARAMAARGLTDDIEPNLKKSIESDPQFVLPLLMLGQLYRERALTEEAIEYGGQSYTTATFAEERAGLLAKAAAILQKALDIEPANPIARTELAMVQLAGGGTEQAKASLKKALEADRSFTPAHYQMAAVLIRSGDLRGGEDHLAAAKKLNPLDHRLYVAIAEAYEARGMVREAVAAYRKGAELLWSARGELFPLSFGRP
jgi:peroxiredoxin/Tfp pilus assembly protein PilF